MEGELRCHSGQMLMGCMFTSLKICNLKFCVEGTYCTFSPVWGSNHRSQNSQRMTNTHQSFHNFSSSARIPGVPLGLGLGGDKRGTRVPNLEAQTQRVTSTLCSPSPKCELLLKFGPWRSHLLHPSPRTPCWKLPPFFFLNSHKYQLMGRNTNSFGSHVVKTGFPLQGVRVQSLMWELRSYRRHGLATKKKKRKRERKKGKRERERCSQSCKVHFYENTSPMWWMRISLLCLRQTILSRISTKSIKQLPLKMKLARD